MTLTVIGDSIACGFGVGLLAFPGLLADEGYDVVNLCRSSTTLVDWHPDNPGAPDWPLEFGEVGIVELGTNGARTLPGRSPIPPDAHTRLMRIVLREMFRLGAIRAIVIVPPSDCWPPGPDRERLEAYQSADLLICLMDVRVECADVSGAICVDGVHPGPVWHRRVADGILDLLPEPSGGALGVTALLTLAAMRRTPRA